MPDASAAWDSGNIARSEAERGRYGPEFDQDRKRPPAPCRAPVGLTD